MVHLLSILATAARAEFFQINGTIHQFKHPAMRLAYTLFVVALASAELLSPAHWRDRVVNQHNLLEPQQRPSPKPLECFQVTSPIDTPRGLAVGDRIVEKHETLPSCSHRLMQHTFGNSYGKPFVGNYEPPPCEFDNVYINLTATSTGVQFDRLATMWLGDVEVWRTSTPEPTSEPGIVWHFLKDMTSYLSLWKKKQRFIFDLGNLINDKKPAPWKSLWKPPSSSLGASSAFVFPDTKAEAKVKLPRNVGSAILTVAATGQASEEFWWSNVPQSAVNYFDYNNGDELPGLGSFREVRVLIDGLEAGFAWPFPVVFTGGISPPLHRPMVGLEPLIFERVSMEVFGVTDKDGNDKPGLVHAGSNWVLSGKIFAWLDSKALAPSALPQISLGGMEYKADVIELGPTEFYYTHYVGRGISKRGMERTLATHFRYPINTTYHYQSPDGQNSLSLEATLSQGLNLAVTLGRSPFATGLAPFFDRLQKGVTGSMLHARRDGRAYFLQSPGRSVGAGQTSQQYQLMSQGSGLQGSNPLDNPGPILYERSTMVANETTVRDKEVVRGKTSIMSQPLGLEVDTVSGEPSVFAPMSLDRVGGTNIFFSKEHTNMARG
ncbi:Peptide-N4-like protein [Hapsidospora chrysogenum ATCC 11550]|uniref:Peptide-N4-like protein n=1 Tax=Hapsidospora chrysogenum (strain ATCC 11550 / CBS 779.69 / DSM 880 / IAM 14645 / JCM 23072 / IMI 49137) TaxID=857340 RepID=A0A086SX57_HAPC1|nr:Peptide-N4-like protein [Hapsidospora chrysogenum ATCC 11550]